VKKRCISSLSYRRSEGCPHYEPSLSIIPVNVLALAAEPTWQRGRSLRQALLLALPLFCLLIAFLSFRMELIGITCIDLKTGSKWHIFTMSSVSRGPRPPLGDLPLHFTGGMAPDRHCCRPPLNDLPPSSYTRAVQPVATCRQSPYLHKPAIVTVTSISLWCHSRVSRLRRSQPPFSLWRHSHCDVIRYWAGHAYR